MLDAFEAETGLDVPVHVDGASGAFVAPFVDPDGLGLSPAAGRVDQRLGHKYGLVYPGVGWVVWRDSAALPAELIFWVNYLGDDMPTFALNFSRPGPGGRPVLQLPPARLHGYAVSRVMPATSRPGSRARSRSSVPSS